MTQTMKEGDKEKREGHKENACSANKVREQEIQEKNRYSFTVRREARNLNIKMSEGQTDRQVKRISWQQPSMVVVGEVCKHNIFDVTRYTNFRFKT